MHGFCCSDSCEELIMAKRGADNYLTDQNWDQEQDETEEVVFYIPPFELFCISSPSHLKLISITFLPGCFYTQGCVDYSVLENVLVKKYETFLFLLDSIYNIILLPRISIYWHWAGVVIQVVLNPHILPRTNYCLLPRK